jgi:hypothetical protein
MNKEPLYKHNNNDNKEKMTYIIYDDINSPDLIGLLSLLCGNEEEYNKHYNARLQPYIILNSYKTLYYIDSSPNNNNITLRKIDSVSPNSSGHVPKLVFPLVSSSSIIVLLVGNQYDIWIGSNISKHDEDAAIELLINTNKDNNNNDDNNDSNNSSSSSSSSNDGNSIIHHSNNIKKIREGYERIPFRSNFEPNIKLGYKLKKYKIIIDDDDSSNNVGCINIGAIADVMNISWLTSYLERNSFHQVDSNKSSSNSSSNSSNSNSNSNSISNSSSSSSSSSNDGDSSSNDSDSSSSNSDSSSSNSDSNSDSSSIDSNSNVT